jgi:hypothetical protein
LPSRFPDETVMCGAQSVPQPVVSSARRLRPREGRHAVSPRQLNTAPNKEASHQAANQWWERKQKEFDEQLGKAKEHPAGRVRQYNLAIRNHRVFARWHWREGNLELAAKSDQAVEFLQEARRSDEPPMLDKWA